MSSVTEGLGTSILDAMACGKAVVGTRTGGIPEVAGDAPMYIVPENVDSVTGMMRRVATESTADRERRAMHVYYTRGDKPQQQYQKRQVRPEVQARLSPLGRRLLALDDVRNDELSATGSGASGFMK